MPIYPLTEGISVHWLRAVMDKAVVAWAAHVPDFLPEEIRRSLDLMSLADALAQIHFPDNMDLVHAADRRLSFDWAWTAASFAAAGALRSTNHWMT